LTGSVNVKGYHHVLKVMMAMMMFYHADGGHYFDGGL
jgi:hypothetical protein